MKQNIEFDEIAGGALKEQFARSFDKVLENLLNPNTSFKTPSEINIKLKFTQSERRDDAKCTVIVTEKLACASPTETAFAIGKDLSDGSVYAEEYGSQMRMRVEESTVPEIDTETGEVHDTPGEIIDLRKTARA